MPLTVNDIEPAKYYSNGAYGRSWGVRLVVELFTDENGERTVRYKGIAGIERRKDGQVSLETFARWAKYEVRLNENSWQRVGFFAEEPDEASQEDPGESAP